VLQSLDERDELDFVCMEPIYKEDKKGTGSLNSWMQYLSREDKEDDDMEDDCDDCINDSEELIEEDGEDDDDDDDMDNDEGMDYEEETTGKTWTNAALGKEQDYHFS
jgi:hypothetical protein